MSDSPLRLLAGSAVLLIGLCACRSNEPDVPEEVMDLMVHARYEEALGIAYQRFQEDPHDPQAQALYSRASVAWLLDKGRQLSFKQADLEALDAFLQAAEIEPDSRMVIEWIAKTETKITTRWLNHALELESSDRLVEAREAYMQALIHHPTNARALAGAGRMTVRLNYRMGLGQDYYNDGVRSFSDYQLEEARSGFERANKYRHDPSRTEMRREQVRKLLARQRVTVAETLAGDGLYAASRNEYRLSLLFDPELTPAAEGLAVMSREAEAMELLKRAQLMILRSRFDEAVEALDKGEALTDLQLDLFEGVRDTIDGARNEAVYQEALTLENDYRYLDAIMAYGRLLESAQFYKDVRARKDTLEQYVRFADELYLKAAETGSAEERLEYLEQIEIFWPEYEDIQEQLTVLRAGAGE